MEGRVSPSTHAYGPHQEQFYRVHTPAGAAPPGGWPFVCVVHGGYWKAKYGVDSAAIETVAPGLCKDGGVAAVEFEYRRVGHEGGGWPGTCEDIVAAYTHVWSEAAAGRLPLDVSRAALLGHSAGGHLAFWAAEAVAEARAQGTAGTPPPPLCAIGVAPVADLVEAARLRVSDEGDAVQRFMGGREPREAEAAYRLASPADRFLPNRVPQFVLMGDADTDVPPGLVRHYLQRAQEKQGSSVHAEWVGGADHFAVVSAGHAECWGKLLGLVRRGLGIAK